MSNETESAAEQLFLPPPHKATSIQAGSEGRVFAMDNSLVNHPPLSRGQFERTAQQSIPHIPLLSNPSTGPLWPPLGREPSPPLSPPRERS